MNIRQIIPQDYCQKCDICCHFPEALSELRPTFFNKEIIKKDYFFILDNLRPCKINPIPFKDFYICPHFDPEKHKCSIYKSRPFDCRLYPFMITYNKDYTSIQLVIDTKCPFIKNKTDFESYAKEIFSFLEDDLIVNELYRNFSFINNYQEDCIPLFTLPKLSGLMFKGGYGLKKLNINDKELFKNYFKLNSFGLSPYSFEYLFAFSDIINTLWKIINDTLFIFYDATGDFFMPIIPLGKNLDKKTIDTASGLLSGIAKTHPRIENVPKIYADLFKNAGFKITKNEEEYLIPTKDIEAYKGEKFKTKRALYNYFVKNYSFKLKNFEERISLNCLNLYRRWSKNRLEKYKDTFYKNLVEDGVLVHKKLLENYAILGLEGLFLEIDNKIAAYTIGYPLNKEIFVIFSEITDLKYKGISEFIFSEFAKKLNKFKYLNIMGDAGFENLRKTKLSYKPEKIISSFSSFKE